MNLIDYVNNNKYTVILCLGDSITEANHCSEGHPGYVGLLDEALRLACSKKKFVIINAGIGGSRISDSQEFLKGLIKRFKPEITTLMFGMNDSVEGGQGVDVYRQALEEMVEFVRAENSIPVLLTQNPVDYACNLDPVKRRPELPKFMEEVRKCAQKLGVDLVDITKSWQEEVLDVSNNEHMKFMHDGAHPNNHGHKFMFEQIEKMLLKK